MRVTIDVRGLDAARQDLVARFSGRRFRAAMATAATRTVRELGKQWQRQFGQEFDRPTPTTLRGVRTTMATAANLQAEVAVKDQATGNGAAPLEWLAPEERGGQRSIKRFEAALQAQGSMPRGWRAVPGPAAKLDAYGNVGRGQIVQVLAQLGSQYSPGYQRVISNSAAKRAASALRRGRAYVAILPGNKDSKRTPGVYERRGRGLLPVFLYVPSVQYRKRLRLIQRAQVDAGPILQRELMRAVDESAARLAARGAR